MIVYSSKTQINVPEQVAALPQTGEEPAMALVAVQSSESFAQVPPMVLASTALFELLGPLCTRRALREVREA